jgi:O-antigen/teichoic acid export membrane protein
MNSRFHILRPMNRSFLTLLDQAVYSGTTFLSGAIVAHFSAPEDFGLYSLVFIGLAWAFSLQGAIVTTPYLFRRRQLPEAEQRRYAAAVIVSQLIFAGGLSALCFVVASSGLIGGQASRQLVSSVIAMAGAVSGLCLMRECCRQMSFGHERFVPVLLMDAVVAALQLAGLWVVSHAGDMTVGRAFMIIGLANMLPMAAWLVTNRDLFEFRHLALRHHAAQSLRFGRWIIAGVVVHAVAKDTFPYLVTGFHGTRAAASLAAAFGIGFLGNPLITAATNWLSPIMARSYAESGRSALAAAVVGYTRVAVIVSTLYAGAILLFGEQLSTLVYGAQYAGSGYIAGWLAVGVAISSATLPIGVALYAQHRANVTFGAVCVAALIAAVVSVPLVAKYAALGAAIALLLENVGESITKVVWYRKVMRADARTDALVATGPAVLR